MAHNNALKKEAEARIPELERNIAERTAELESIHQKQATLLRDKQAESKERQSSIRKKIRRLDKTDPQRATLEEALNEEQENDNSSLPSEAADAFSNMKKAIQKDLNTARQALETAKTQRENMAEWAKKSYRIVNALYFLRFVSDAPKLYAKYPDSNEVVYTASDTLHAFSFASEDEKFDARSALLALLNEAFGVEPEKALTWKHDLDLSDELLTKGLKDVKDTIAFAIHQVLSHGWTSSGTEENGKISSALESYETLKGSFSLQFKNIPSDGKIVL